MTNKSFLHLMDVGTECGWNIWANHSKHVRMRLNHVSYSKIYSLC